MLLPPMKFDCCFHCSTHAGLLKVENLLKEKFTCESAWLQARDRMLQPILRRMAEASQGYMPVRWTDARMPLPTYESLGAEPSGIKRDVRSIFWRLCRIVRFSFEEYVSGNILFEHEITPNESVLQSFYRMASSTKLLTAMNCNQELTVENRTPEAMHLSFQISLVNNYDGVLDTLYNLVIKKNELSKVVGDPIMIHIHSGQ